MGLRWWLLRSSTEFFSRFRSKSKGKNTTIFWDRNSHPNGPSQCIFCLFRTGNGNGHEIWRTRTDQNATNWHECSCSYRSMQDRKRRSFMRMSSMILMVVQHTTSFEVRLFFRFQRPLCFHQKIVCKLPCDKSFDLRQDATWTFYDSCATVLSKIIHWIHCQQKSSAMSFPLPPLVRRRDTEFDIGVLLGR